MEKFKMTLAGLTHIYGFGGLHAAKKIQRNGYFLLIDVKQFFPTIILNNNFLSRSIKILVLFLICMIKGSDRKTNLQDVN